MKKIFSLIGCIGLLAILFGLPKVNAQASDAGFRKSIMPGDKFNPEQDQTPWYSEAWNYRKPIVITNDGASLPWYQVLIKLDAGNFNFSLAKNDGSDVRFTHGDGTTNLSYWIESWNSIDHIAYLWVKVPGIAMGNNSTYLYYGNPNATAESLGTTTFDSFDDDWNQFTGGALNQVEEFQKHQLSGEIYSPFTWLTISGSPEASGGIIVLMNGDGIKSTSSYLYKAMGMRAKFASGEGYEWGGFINGSSGQQAMIGELPSDANNLFLLDFRNSLESILFPRVGGLDWHNNYHIYEVRWNGTQSKGDIDHGVSTATSKLPAQVPNTNLPVTLYSYIGSNATLTVDWVYVRQYRDPEPTSLVGAEQGLVKLSINNNDSPDPIRPGQRLIYQLTISNTSLINAPGVVVTDTLPANVQLGPISSSQGSCVPGSVIHCDLNTINANSTAWITINVTPTVDGEITNTAAVGSPGYELDLSDNIGEQVTLVDSVAPLANWVSPIGNGGIFRSVGGSALLKVSASDNDQVARVEFWWVDNGTYLLTSTVTTPPYQASFNCNILKPGLEYFFEVRAFDRAGNSNYPDNRRYIFIERFPAIFLPIVTK